jgi:hypothetical protein
VNIGFADFDCFASVLEAVPTDFAAGFELCGEPAAVGAAEATDCKPVSGTSMATSAIRTKTR